MFGFGMDLDGDVFVAGTPYKTGWFGGAGNAVVFRKMNGIWTEAETLPGLPNDANNTDNFGSVVRVKNGRIIVGAPQYDEAVSGYGAAGAVVVFDEVNGAFTQTEVLTQPPGATDHQFGFSIDYDGTYVLAAADVGALMGTNPSAGVSSIGVDGFDGDGAVYLFEAGFTCNPDGTCACLSGYSGGTCDVAQ